MSKPVIDKNIKVPDGILQELLTPSEARMLKNRWQILQLLAEGLSIRQVAKQVKVGTDTVVRMSRMVGKNNLRKKLQATLPQTGQAKSTWIFGRSE